MKDLIAILESLNSIAFSILSTVWIVGQFASFNTDTLFTWVVVLGLGVIANAVRTKQERTK